MASNVSGDIGALYQAVKQHVGKVRRGKRLPVPPAGSVTVHSQRCGSRLTLDARIQGGRIYEIG